MATFYTDAGYNSTDGLYYRAKCDYSTSSTNTQYTITAKMTLQYYGTYASPSSTFNAGANALVSIYGASSQTTGYIKPTTSKTSWTDIATKSITTTVNRTTTTSQRKIYISVSNMFVGLDKENEVTLTIPALPSYTVSYAANGGSSTPSSQTKYYGVTLTLRSAISHASTSPGNYTVTLNGNGASNPTALTSKRTVTYAFNKWKATNGTLYAGNGDYTANAATTMTAQWTTTETRAIVVFPSHTRTNYVFKRWNTNTSDTGTAYNAYASYTPTGNITFYAIWNAQIAYNANGGTGAPATQTKTFGSTLNLQSSTPTRTGYTFSKWNSAANGSGTDYTPSQTLAADDNTAKTLYAQWTANTYTISFNANGGIGAPSNISKTYGQSVTLPTGKPTRIGHTFLGWALSSSAETAQWLAGSNFSEAITANTTLYAVWRDDYESPSITTLRAYRCGFELTQDAAIDPDKTYYERSGSGTSEDPYIYTEVEEPDVSEISTYYELIDDDEAGYARIEATWSIDTSVDEGVVNSATMTGTITPEGQPAQAITFQSGYQGTSGNAVALIDGLDVDTQYTVKVTVTDVRGASAATNRTVLLLRAFYIFDFGSQGNAVGIGRAAPQSGMEVGYPATFDDTVNLYDELQFNGEQAYPTFSRSSWSTSSDQTTLPVTPCFVHDTTSGVAYWCDGTTIASLGYLPLSGGTVTGWLNLESSNFDRDAAAPSSDKWGNSYVRLTDKDGEIVGQLRAINRANGIMSCRIGVFGENTSGTEVSNTIELQVAKDGTQSYYITNPDAFCSAISALATTGGTLTGDITIANTNPHIYLKNTDAQSNVTTSGEFNVLYFQDKNGATFGRINPWINNGVQYMRYLTQRVISGTNKYNIVSLGVDASGNAVVSLSGDGVGAAWRNAIGATSGVWKSGTLLNTGWTYAAGSASAAFYVRWCKIGHVVYVEVYGTKSMTAGTTATISTTAISSGNRPSKEADGFLYSSQDHIGALWVTTGGDVRGRILGAAASAIYGTISYPVI